MKNSLRAGLAEELDQGLPSLRAALGSAQVPSQGWLRTVREAKGMSQAAAAAKADIKQQAFAQFETREVKGTITLESMAYAADALDCEVAYFLVPKSAGAFSYGRSRGELTRTRPKQVTVRTKSDAPKDRVDEDLPMELR